MSLRPRFAGDGRLRRPATATMPRREPSLVMGEFGDSTTDPFERAADGLLLAESFARLDLDQPRKARAWFLGHGALDLQAFFPADHGRAGTVEHEWFADELAWVATQQANVRWHLITLARLSLEHLSAAQRDVQPEHGWQTSWAGPAISGEREILWLGAPTNFEAHIHDVMATYPRHQDVPAAEFSSLERRDGFEASLKVDEWWPLAHAAWQRIVEQRVPVLWVPSEEWREEWHRFIVVDAANPAHPGDVVIEPDRRGLIDIQRRLMTPYVKRAASQRVEIGLTASVFPDPARLNGPPEHAAGPIQIRERRLWSSLLAPVYLQLFEALRRVSEGNGGAAWCRECGQPFLTLDARRSTYCNDKERYRYSQRERRKRLDSGGIDVSRSKVRQ